MYEKVSDITLNVSATRHWVLTHYDYKGWCVIGRWYAAMPHIPLFA